MKTVLVAVVVVITTTNWIRWRLATKALIWHMIDKGYDMPDETELKRCMQEVVDRTIADIRKGK